MKFKINNRKDKTKRVSKMANEKNLKPIRTKSEAREKGKKGGIKSGEVRAQRKTLKEELLVLLETKVEDKTIQEKISFSLIQEALSGNVKAFETIRDTIGEKPQDKVNISGEVNNPFSGMSTEELRKILNE